MKHKPSVTFFLILIFVMTQVIGLTLIHSISQDLTVDEEGNINIEQDAATEDLTPRTTGFGSLLYIIIAVALGTAALLLIVRFNKVGLWKVWFFMAVTIAVGIAFKVLLKEVLPEGVLLEIVPWLIGAVLALLKMYYRNVFVYNLAEIFMYSGIALILAPIFSVFWAVLLLILISIYDMIAVWKSKHMVKMAKFQSNSKMFAGLMIPYHGKQASKRLSGSKAAAHKSGVKAEHKLAVLGGGDVTFPLIFAGAVLRALIVSGIVPSMALFYSFIIVATTTISLTALFMLAEKDKFYPAMPFVSAGCFVGWFIVGFSSGVFL